MLPGRDSTDAEDAPEIELRPSEPAGDAGDDGPEESTDASDPVDPAAAVLTFRGRFGGSPDRAGAGAPSDLSDPPEVDELNELVDPLFAAGVEDSARGPGFGVPGPSRLDEPADDGVEEPVAFAGGLGVDAFFFPFKSETNDFKRLPTLPPTRRSKGLTSTARFRGSACATARYRRSDRTNRNMMVAIPKGTPIIIRFSGLGGRKTIEL